jgi:hypothetical protein
MFQRMSRRVRWAVGVVTAVGALSLLLHVVGGLPEAQAPWALPVAACACVVLLAILHGQATGCPACGRWWARAEIEKALVDRRGLGEEGPPFGQSVSRATYECGGCGHRWSVLDGEEKREPAQGRPQRHPH